MKRPALLILTLASLIPPSGAQSQATPARPRVQFTLTQDLVQRVGEDGRSAERIVPGVRTVVAGDLLREQISVRNISGKALRRVFVGSPVPRGTEFMGEVTANTGRWRVEYSIDGGQTYSAAPKRTVTVSENGKTVTREVIAPVSLYTNVRWTVDELRPGETLNFAFRVRVKEFSRD